MKTVGELIKDLKKYDPKSVVILSRDNGGSEYSPLADGYSKGVYEPLTPRRGDFYDEWDIEESEEGLSASDKAVNCVVLWPLN